MQKYANIFAVCFVLLVDKHSLYIVHRKYVELHLQMGRKWIDFLNATECKILNDAKGTQQFTQIHMSKMLSKFTYMMKLRESVEV